MTPTSLPKSTINHVFGKTHLRCCLARDPRLALPVQLAASKAYMEGRGTGWRLESVS